MQEKEYIKSLKSFSNFQTDIKENRLFHAIMLISPDSEFLRVYSKLLAGEILAYQAENRENTLIKVAKGVHPDLFVYGEDKPIDADTAKEIASEVYVAPYEGDKKVYVISKFDEVMASPANKLLKTLEEPPSGVTFILLVKNDARVLQTLLSRSQKFYLEGFSVNAVAEILKDRGVKNSEVISLEAGGNLAEAMRLSENKNAFNMANFVVDTLENFKLTTQLAEKTLEVEEYKDMLPELFSFFASTASLAIHSRAGREISCDANFKLAVERIGRMWKYQALAGVIEASVTAQKMLESFVGVGNVTDQFFLKILEIRRKCRV